MISVWILSSPTPVSTSRTPSLYFVDLVECESPSDDPSAVNRFVDLFASKVSDIASIETFPGGAFGRHLRCEFHLPGASQKSGQVLALGHSDTVWPLGTLADDAVPRSRGTFMGSWRARHESWARVLRDSDARLSVTSICPVSRRVVLQINADEEMGSESSRPLTEEAARRSDYVLVLEPGTGLDGKLKTARKGVGGYTVTVRRQSGPFRRRFYRGRERCSGTRPADRHHRRVHGPRVGA